MQRNRLFTAILPDEKFKQALHEAIFGGNLKQVDLLLKRNVDLESVSLQPLVNVILAYKYQLERYASRSGLSDYSNVDYTLELNKQYSLILVRLLMDEKIRIDETGTYERVTAEQLAIHYKFKDFAEIISNWRSARSMRAHSVMPAR